MPECDHLTSRPPSIYNRAAMKKMIPVVIILALCSLTACNKAAGPAASPSAASSPAKPPDAVTQKLQEHSGTNATDCGRLDISASQAQLKTASDCALQASQGKHPFYVAYDMPGMSVGVAAAADGRLYTVQSQGTGATPTVTSGDCPAQLRVASSGRVTCFAPGDMGSMGSGHGGDMSRMSNPHASSGAMQPSHKP